MDISSQKPILSIELSSQKPYILNFGRSHINIFSFVSIWPFKNGQNTEQKNLGARKHLNFLGTSKIKILYIFRDDKHI
jgi:hypothetical protein